MTNAEAWFNIALRPRKPEGLLGQTAQDGRLDSHTAPELCTLQVMMFQHSSTATSIKLLGDGVWSVCVKGGQKGLGEVGLGERPWVFQIHQGKGHRKDLGHQPLLKRWTWMTDSATFQTYYLFPLWHGYGLVSFLITCSRSGDTKSNICFNTVLNKFEKHVRFMPIEQQIK